MSSADSSKIDELLEKILGEIGLRSPNYIFMSVAEFKTSYLRIKGWIEEYKKGEGDEKSD